MGTDEPRSSSTLIPSVCDVVSGRFYHFLALLSSCHDFMRCQVCDVPHDGPQPWGPASPCSWHEACERPPKGPGSVPAAPARRPSICPGPLAPPSPSVSTSAHWSGQVLASEGKWPVTRGCLEGDGLHATKPGRLGWGGHPVQITRE